VSFRKAEGAAIIGDDDDARSEMLASTLGSPTKPPLPRFQDLFQHAARALLWSAGIYDLRAALDLLLVSDVAEEGRAWTR
jgi:hypothetical protein